MKRVEVRRLDTGESWPSIRSAAMGLHVSESHLQKLHLRRADECCGVPIEFIHSGKCSSSKRVKRMDTGEIFESMTEAALAMGLKPGTIAQAVRLGYKCQGIWWRSV